jgi:hypothetical protein
MIPFSQDHFLYIFRSRRSASAKIGIGECGNKPEVNSVMQHRRNSFSSYQGQDVNRSSSLELGRSYRVLQVVAAWKITHHRHLALRWSCVLQNLALHSTLTCHVQALFEFFPLARSPLRQVVWHVCTVKTGITPACTLYYHSPFDLLDASLSKPALAQILLATNSNDHTPFTCGSHLQYNTNSCLLNVEHPPCH